MTTRTARKATSLATKSIELAWAVPLVVGHRLTRMAIAGAEPSASDRKEFQLMVAEKQVAFAQAWLAMSMQVMLSSQALAAACVLSCWPSSAGRRRNPAKLADQFQNVALSVAGKGLAPVHRKAVANARRLARTKLRLVEPSS